MERKLSVPVYIAAFFMSLLIFVTGVYIGYLIDDSNLRSVSEEVTSISDRLSSSQLLLLMEGDETSCPVYLAELDAIDADVERIGHILTYLEEEKGVFDDDLKRKYFVLEAESYLLSKKAKELCGGEDVLLIHFYSNKDCRDCRAQGTEILKARDTLKGELDLKLFSFDGTLDSPVAEALEAQFNITSYPSIVIDGKTYSGYRSSAEIASMIRSSG